MTEASRPRPRPLSGLLARALGDLTASFAAAGAGRDGMPSAPMWFGFLRTVPVAGSIPQRDLPAAARLSKRAVRQLVLAVTRCGWAAVVSGTGVSASIGLTAAGREAAARWPSLVGPTEERWCQRVGADPLVLSRTLAEIVGQLD